MIQQIRMVHLYLENRRKVDTVSTFFHKQLITQRGDTHEKPIQ